MNQIDNNVNPLVKMSSDFGRIFKICVLYTVLVLWRCAAIFWCIDDDLLLFLLPLIVVAVVTLVVVYTIISNRVMSVYQDKIFGRMHGKVFFLPLELIQSVHESGINGIAITSNLGEKYKFQHIKNRDEICTVLSNLGVVVDQRLLKFKDTIITSESDTKKHSIFRIVSLISIILSNILLTVSAIWYNSSSNWYIKYRTESTWYGSVKKFDGFGCNWDVSGMPTTYIAIGLFVVFLVLTALYFVKANNKATINATMFRGVNGFGKVTLIPIEQISSVSISSMDSSITINQMGIKHKFYFLINNTLLCEAINNIKSGKHQSAVAEQSFSNANSTDNDEIKAKNIKESAEEIQKLKFLLDEGVITEEEFNSILKSSKHENKTSVQTGKDAGIKDNDNSGLKTISESAKEDGEQKSLLDEDTTTGEELNSDERNESVKSQKAIIVLCITGIVFALVNILFYVTNYWYAFHVDIEYILTCGLMCLPYLFILICSMITLLSKSKKMILYDITIFLICQILLIIYQIVVLVF